jgi:hypothetical protein
MRKFATKDFLSEPSTSGKGVTIGKERRRLAVCQASFRLWVRLSTPSGTDSPDRSFPAAPRRLAAPTNRSWELFLPVKTHPIDEQVVTILQKMMSGKGTTICWPYS